jgi:DNA-binding winged helix-turn-helix (wHTH) protein
MAQAETAMLILQAGGNEAGRRWPLQRGRTVVGRNIDCDIVLADRLVSRHHAQVVWGQISGREGYVVEDLRSKNGTFVNGQELAGPHLLEDGDEIQIALRFKLAFVDAGETAPLTFDLPAGVERLRLDDDARQVIVKDQVIDPPLSPAQYRLLALLMASQGSVVGRDDIVRQVWPEALEEGVSEQAIDALVRRLRERLAEVDPGHQYIITVRGHGFRFENAPAWPAR